MIPRLRSDLTEEASKPDRVSHVESSGDRKAILGNNRNQGADERLFFLRRVEEGLTTSATPIKKFIYQCLEDACSFKSIHRERFIIHLRCLHHIEVDERMLEFPDWNKFQQWKTSLEAETRAKFVKVTTL